MAKVGNETKLVLRLAKEKAKAEISKKITEAPVLTDFLRGQDSGFTRYENILDEIVNSLERER